MLEDRFQLSKGCHEKIQNDEDFFDIRNMGGVLSIKLGRFGFKDSFSEISEESPGYEPKSDQDDRQYTSEQIEKFGA